METLIARIFLGLDVKDDPVVKDDISIAEAKRYLKEKVMPVRM